MDDERIAEGDDGEVVVVPATASSLVKTLVRALLSPSASSVLIERVGELLAEDARFNRWVLEDVKRQASETTLWELLDIADDVNGLIAQSWKACLERPHDGMVWTQLETNVQLAASQLKDARARDWKHS